MKGCGFESLLERRENFLLQGRLSVLTPISVSVPPRVTTVARKKSRSVCQKCRWQVTAKHACTLRIEPCFGIGHNLSLICQMTSEDIKHQLNNIRSTTSTTNYPRNISWNISCKCNASHVCKPMKSTSFASTSSTFVLLASKLECVQDCQNEEVGFLTLCFVGSCLEGRGFRKHSGQDWNCFKGNIAIGGISERRVGVRNMWAFLSAPVDI